MTGEAPCALIATALPVEFGAARAFLHNSAEVEHSAGTIYEVGTFVASPREWRVAILQTGQGNPRAAMEVERAISWFHPSHVFFVGVAGGLKDVRLGDVVAATKIYGYEFGKASDDYLPRLEFGESAYALQQRAIAVARGQGWLTRAGIATVPPGATPPRALVGPIAAGEKVVASIDSQLYAFLTRTVSDALAVEMESYGFFRAIFANAPVQGLVVRGISDLIKGKSQADASGSQEVASYHAAAFAFEVLAAVRPPDGTGYQPKPTIQDAPSVKWRDQLIDLAATLYPRGPEERQVWLRAGGDIAAIDLHASGRASWFAALRVLQLGGGGAGITVATLVHTMQEDFPNNGALQRLASYLA